MWRLFLQSCYDIKVTFRALFYYIQAILYDGAARDSLGVAEGVVGGVATLTARDQDEGQGHDFAIVTQPGGGHFAVEGDTLKVWSFSYLKKKQVCMEDNLALRYLISI